MLLSKGIGYNPNDNNNHFQEDIQMNLWMKRPLSIALVSLFTALSLAACGTSTTNPSGAAPQSNSAPAAPAASTTATPAPTAGTEGKITVQDAQGTVELAKNL